MQRELATDARDLPHTFVQEKASVERPWLSTCDVCERDSGHALHNVMSIEQASFREVLQTEKGS